MIRKIIRFVLILALGAVLGYVLSPTIDGVVKTTDVSEQLEDSKDRINEMVQANEKVQNKIDSSKAE